MNIYGVRGYPTPDFTEERYCRTFSIPNTTIALAVFMGALWTLTQEENWQQYGDMTPAEAASQFQDMVWQAYAESDNICPVAEAPYWDTAANVDDTLPVGSETWYGQIVTEPALLADPELTFLDNLGIWAVAGFIAYAGLPGAAIAFVPVARRFVLFFKQSPTGAIVNILADFLHIAEIDTYGTEDRIQKILVTMPEDATTLYVMQADESNPLAGDNPQIQVVRSELTEDNFSNPAYRYNVDCDCVQYSPDGGTTWNDAPGNDPRHADAFRLPPRGGSDPNCHAAANMVNWVKRVIDECTAICCVGGIVIALVNKILEFAEVIFAEAGGVLLNLIVAVAGTLFDTGCTALTIAFTPDQYDLLLCIFLCNSASNGQVSATQFESIQTEVTAKLNTTAAIVVNLFLSIQGQVGLSNAGAIGTATADCSPCDCCDPDFCATYDFLSAESPFVIWDDRGSYADGVGFVSSAPYPPENPSSVLGIKFTFPCAKVIHSIRVVYTDGGGDGGDGTRGIYDLSVSTVQIQNLRDGDTWTGSRLMSVIGVEVDNHSANATGIQSVIIDCS